MKFIRYTQPLQFALLALILYIMLYHPPLTPNAEDFVTLLMVFTTALGWSGTILVTQRKTEGFLFIYVIISLLTPILFFLLCPGFRWILHGVTYLVSVLILLIIRFYTASHIKHTSK